MSEDNKIRRIKETAKINPDTTAFTSLSLDSARKTLPHNDIREIVSSMDVLNEERNQSTRYRFSFSLKDVFHNTNFNQSGSTSYGDIDYKSVSSNIVLDDGPRGYFMESIVDDPDATGNNIITIVNGEKVYSGDYLTGYTKSVKEAIIKKDGWYGYITGETNNCSIIRFEPSPSRFEMITKTGGTNWDFLLTYPSGEDYTYKFKSSTVEVPLSKGVAIANVKSVKYDERNMMQFTAPINHNLVAGSKINLYNATTGVTFEIYRIGDFSGNNRNNVFVIDTEPITTWYPPDLKFKRLVQGVESSYYVRKLTPVTGLTYDLFKESFATNIYGDRTHQVVYNSDLDMLSYKDNKGIYISEMYLTIIKNRDNNFWEPIQSGIQTKVDNNYNIRNIIRTGGTAMESAVTKDSTSFCLDVTEYNKMEIRETTLADVYHRTNSKNREDCGCNEGYFYLPHHFIKIRDFSNEIEFGDPDTVIGIPEWAEDYTDGTKMWRDMYTIGFVDSDGNGVDYPFINGVHYMFSNIQLNLLRQDPFDLYKLNDSNCYVIGPYGIIEDDKEQDFYEC